MAARQTRASAKKNPKCETPVFTRSDFFGTVDTRMILAINSVYFIARAHQSCDIDICFEKRLCVRMSLLSPGTT